MNNRLKQADTSLVAFWIIACAIGAAIGGSVGVIVGEHVGFPLGNFVNGLIGTPLRLRNIVSSTTAGVFSGSASASIMGLAQWFVLRNYIERAVWWIPASMVGVVVGSTLNSAIVATIGLVIGRQASPIALLAGGAILLSPIAGLVTGLAEWGVLHGQLPRARWWIVARAGTETIVTILNVFGAVIGLVAGIEIVRFMCNVSVGFLSGAVFGAITGSVLYWLLHHRDRSKAV